MPHMSEDFVRAVGIAGATLIFLVLLLCVCFACPCCLWYKRRHQGTVYHSVTVAGVPCQNTAVLPVTQHVIVSGTVQPAQSYASPNAVPPNAYPVQQTIPVGYVLTSGASNPMPPHHIGGMQMPMGQPPPYSEVVQMHGAAGVSSHEAYSKQAPCNPHFNTSNP